MAPSWLIEIPSCDSTNSWALAHSTALAHGACIFTTHQTHGRGQPGNVWLSPPGVVTGSIILDLDPRVPIPQLALAAGLAVAHTAEDFAPAMRVAIKWPNDCLIGQRKLAGILCERASADHDRVVIGTGVNLDPQWDQLPLSLPLASNARWAPVSIAEFTNTIPTSVDVLGKIRQYLFEAVGLMAAGAWRKLLPELLARDALKGQPLLLTTASTIVQGIGDGIDEQGRLLVATSNGTEAIASARSVTIRSE